MKRKLAVLLGYGVVIGLAYPSGISHATTMTFYADGVIQAGDIYDIVEVYDTPPARTTVDMTGGQVDSMSTFDTSVVNIGGSVGFLQTNDSSTVNLSGSGFIDGGISLNNSSTLNFRGGAWEADSGYLVAFDSSTLNVYDGIVGLVSGANVVIADNSTANIYGGYAQAPYVAFGSSTMNIYDGRVGTLGAGESSVVNIYGGEIGGNWGFGVYQSATANIYGSDFQYDPQWFWDDYFGRWISRFTGTGPDGLPIDIRDMPDPFTSPNINLIPEPATASLVGLGSLGLLRRRKVNG